MSKELEALGRAILEFEKELEYDYNNEWLKRVVTGMKKCYQRLKAIDEANPSKALMCLKFLGDFEFHKKYFKEAFPDLFDTIEPALLKAQENENLLKSGDLSDGYHTFNQLYYQRCILFASLVRLNKNKSWKSFKHSDGKYCFDSNGDWFIVGIDTPTGSYTYHYEKKYWDLFECQELECGKEWDGHTEEDVTRLLSLSNEQINNRRTFNKNIQTLKEYVEKYSDKPIAYISKTYGNKYIVPEEQFDDLTNENAEYKEVLKIMFEKNVDIWLLKSCLTVELYNFSITKMDNCNVFNLTQYEFDLLKRWQNNICM